MKRIEIYRVTHIDNLAHIIQYGITHKDSANRNSKFVSIGDTSLISVRATKPTPYGTVLGEYIPFYFCSRSPMVYVILKDFNGVPIQRPSKLVYCVSSVQDVLSSGTPYIYTDGHATDSLTTFYKDQDPEEMVNHLDFNAIDATFWNDENDLDVKRRKEAELLLLGDLPFKHILGFIVYDEYTKKALLALGINKSKVLVSPQRYF